MQKRRKIYESNRHEQYFYSHYFNYEPDYRERIFAAVDFCVRNGYRPATLTSVALEPRY